jgi:hypothetical protein
VVRSPEIELPEYNFIKIKQFVAPISKYMGVFNQTIHKFSNSVMHGSIRKFANQAVKAVKVGGAFIEKTGLPALEKATKFANTALTIAEPFIAVTAPSLLPGVETARRGTKYLDTGLKKVELGIDLAHTIKKTVGQVRQGDMAGAITSGLKMRRAGKSLIN